MLHKYPIFKNFFSWFKLEKKWLPVICLFNQSHFFFPPPVTFYFFVISQAECQKSFNWLKSVFVTQSRLFWNACKVIFRFFLFLAKWLIPKSMNFLKVDIYFLAISLNDVFNICFHVLCHSFVKTKINKGEEISYKYFFSFLLLGCEKIFWHSR